MKTSSNRRKTWTTKDTLPPAEELVGLANAWISLENGIKDLCEESKVAQRVKAEVSSELFRDGCHSSSIHTLYFIRALVAQVEDNEDLNQLLKH